MLATSTSVTNEGGTVFCALIEKIDGTIKATCFTSLDHPYEMPNKRPVTSIFPTRKEAEAWASQKARAQGFAKIRWLAPID